MKAEFSESTASEAREMVKTMAVVRVMAIVSDVMLMLCVTAIIVTCIVT